ncbi:MAG: DNA polymerase I [Armatimonadaceae bacterium]
MTDQSTNQSAADTPKKLVLIDGNSLLYRGFFAMRALTTSAGQPTNAIFSFAMMLLTLLDGQKPDVMVAAWDRPEPTFRHLEFDEYKAQRASTPSELVQQGPIARELLEAFQIPMVDAVGFEADDVIGTLARQGRDKGYSVLIVTGDLDSLQLVEPGVQVMTTVKGVTDTIIYDEAAVADRYGLRPEQLTDYRALKGDTSDNIPGVAGVGEKTATKLLQEFDTVESLLKRLSEVKPERIQKAIDSGREQMLLSKRLATIVCDVPLPDYQLPLPESVTPYTPDYNAVRELFERLEFRTLQRRLKNAGDQKADSGNTTTTDADSPVDLESPDYDPFADLGEEPAGEEATGELVRVEVNSPVQFAEAEAEIRRAERVAVALHTRGEGLLDSELCGVAFAPHEGKVFYVPLETAPATPTNSLGGLFDDSTGNPGDAGEGNSALSAPSHTTTELREAGEAGSFVARLLEDERVPKVTHDAKTTLGILKRYGVEIRGIRFDVELAAYLLNAGRRASFPLVEIASDYAGRELHPLDKKERKAKTAEEIEAYERGEAEQAAEAIFATAKVQEPRLAAEELTGVLEDIELPVAPVLAEMELIGMAVDVNTFQRLSGELGERITELEREIYQIAGEEFLISSPKQLQGILFEKLSLPTGKKTKTGYSTDANVLEELAADYPIVSLILEHRELSKLKSTYADAMPALVRKDTHRLHTTLNQTVAATGRLSSSNPNLQNIPIRTEIGREIRRAFIAPDGWTLVAADYSQIELRIFANVSEDDELRAAFHSGEDIHKYTASRIYGVSVGEVTTDMRRAAKTVNYAVIYGISDFALARQLKIFQKDAKELKESYFARFPGVKQYIEETIEFARKHGYVKTLSGRKRYIPDITSRVFQFRQAAERAAANMPIQGTSADIIKEAMVMVQDRLKQEGFRSRMLLQVHDELLFEAPPDEVQNLAECVRECMMGNKELEIPLEVEVKEGKTWADVTPLT